MTVQKACLLAALSLCLLPPLLSQQKAVFVFGDLTVRAWTLDKGAERIVASGEVEVVYKQVKLYADRIELDTKTKDVLAVGHVSLQLPEEVVDCEKLSFNLDTQMGKLDKAIGRIQPSVMYEAASIERKSDNLYDLEKAKFTSCSQPTPRWNFSFSKANLKKDDYIAMWGAVLSIKKVPIFYWPYIRYPLGQQPRVTGFLMPKIGFSGVKGFSISESFYWAITRNMDASFSLDYYGAKGVGGGLEYRYLFSGGTYGEAHFYYFTFKTPAGQTTQPVKPEDAYIIRWSHNQQLPLGFGLVASVDYQSSFNFIREFDNNFMRAVISNRKSQIYLSKAWSSYTFSIRAARVESMAPSLGSYLIYTYLPQVNIDSFKMKILAPLYFSFSSYYMSYQYYTDIDYLMNKLYKNREFSFSPMLSLPFNSIRWLSVNLSLEGFFNYYWRSQNTQGILVDEPLFTRNFAFNVDFIGPVFYRMWELGVEKGSDGLSMGRLKHIFEPTVSYRYESPIIGSARIYAPYGIVRTHQLEYGFTNHFLLKKGESPKEIFSWEVSQAFNLSPEDSYMKRFPINGKIPRFSDIGSNIRFFPAASYSFDFSASYNPYYKTFSSLRLSANLGSPADNLFLSVTWYKRLYPYFDITSFWNRHQLGGFAGIKIPALSLELNGEIDFNIIEMKIIYSAASLVYHYQCLDLKADLMLFLFREKPDIQFKISFGLGNIGKTTDFLGGARFN